MLIDQTSIPAAQHGYGMAAMDNNPLKKYACRYLYLTF
jgi:hypothetical protein